MSYRDDHDAALLRVNALQNELAQLRKTAEAKPKPPKRSRGHSRLLLGVMAFGTLAVPAVLSVMHLTSTVEASAQVELPAPVAATRPLDSIRTCLHDVVLESDLDATITDPKGDHVSVSAIARTGAACRGELSNWLDTDRDDGELHERFIRWSRAEDSLANSISLITVYYESGPYALDNYASAPQLWREYHRARLDRNQAIGQIGLL